MKNEIIVKDLEATIQKDFIIRGNTLIEGNPGLFDVKVRDVEIEFTDGMCAYIMMIPLLRRMTFKEMATLMVQGFFGAIAVYCFLVLAIGLAPIN